MMKAKETDQELVGKFDQLLQAVQEGKAFLSSVLQENHRLRKQLVELEHDKVAKDGHHSDQVKASQGLEKRLKEVEEENRVFAERYVEIQDQNDKLTNLYVSSYQLHSTLDPTEVHRAIYEILVNLVGAEEFFVCIRNEEEKVPRVVLAEGREIPTVGLPVPMDEVLEGVLNQGSPYFGEHSGDSSVPYLACLPLKVREEVLGFIAILKLMDHKIEGLNTLDHELLNLLADHAATALVSSDLYNRTQRKLKTVQGFMDLLKLDGKKSL